MSEEDRLTPEEREGKAPIKFLRESKEGFWLDKLEASTDTEEDEVVIEDRTYSEQKDAWMYEYNRVNAKVNYMRGRTWRKGCGANGASTMKT